MAEPNKKILKQCSWCFASLPGNYFPEGSTICYSCFPAYTKEQSIRIHSRKCANCHITKPGDYFEGALRVCRNCMDKLLSVDYGQFVIHRPKSYIQVYFVQSIEGGFVKIGKDGNGQRLKSLQTGCPLPLITLATLSGPPDLELELHREFATYREHGEWFRPEPPLLAFIASIPGALQAQTGCLSGLCYPIERYEYCPGARTPGGKAKVSQSILDRNKEHLN
jgi:hypothetical protein